MISRKTTHTRTAALGFTIVELIVVIVIIGILTALSVVVYSGAQVNTHNTTLQSDLRNAATQLKNDMNFTGEYPTGNTVPSTLVASDTNSYQYTSVDGTSYCLTITSSFAGTTAYHISSGNNVVEEGACDGHTTDGSVIIADGWTAIAPGVTHTCGIMTGTIYCWGWNNYGQLGNGTTTDSSTPVAVNTATMSGTVTGIVAGGYHTCATTTSGIYCWGMNNYGQLGNGTTTDSSTPVAVDTSMMSGTVTALAAGNYYHTCAATTNGVYCWGQGGSGQLGNGTTTDSSTPVAVNTSMMPGTVTALAAGNYHTCAATMNGAYCWGQNTFAQLGNGTTAYSLNPVAVNTATMSGTVTALEAGSKHTCATTTSGIYCWGMNNYGQLGNGTTATTLTPVAVDTSMMSGTVTALTLGNDNTCATTTNGAYCWGYNGTGQLGNGTTATTLTPVAVNTSMMSGALTLLMAGINHTCATTTNGAYCWGSNTFGQLGNGTTTTSFTPVIVSPTP